MVFILLLQHRLTCVTGVIGEGSGSEGGGKKWEGIRDAPLSGFVEISYFLYKSVFIMQVTAYSSSTASAI